MKHYKVKDKYNNVIKEELQSKELEKGYFISLGIPEDWLEKVEERVELKFELLKSKQ